MRRASRGLSTWPARTPRAEKPRRRGRAGTAGRRDQPPPAIRTSRRRRPFRRSPRQLRRRQSTRAPRPRGPEPKGPDPPTGRGAARRGSVPQSPSEGDHLAHFAWSAAARPAAAPVLRPTRPMESAARRRTRPSGSARAAPGRVAAGHRYLGSPHGRGDGVIGGGAVRAGRACPRDAGSTTVLFAGHDRGRWWRRGTRPGEERDDGGGEC
jgi:hypothetical protein